jgi:replication-associated recombination protein RarA
MTATITAAIAIEPEIVQSIRARRQAGEPLKSLAQEAGLSWQRLWGLLYPTGMSTGKKAQRPPGPLTERYRPLTLADISGQEGVVGVLSRFAQHPYSTAYLFDGETGTGKTSAALALANALGCDLAKQEFGGVYVIASGEQSADSVRETCRMMYNAPWHGSGWKVVIVNEADRMSSPAETVWLDRLEALPPKTVVIFTTNYAGKLSQRFVDRCTRLTFESGAEKLRASATQFASAIWKSETGRKPDAARIQQIVQSVEANGQISFRRLVQALTVALGLEGGHE